MHLEHLIQLRKARDCRIILSGPEVVLMQPVGRDQLLAAEFVGLAGGRGAEIVLCVVVEGTSCTQYTFMYSSHVSGYLSFINLIACSGISVS